MTRPLTTSEQVLDVTQLEGKSVELAVLDMDLVDVEDRRKHVAQLKTLALFPNLSKVILLIDCPPELYNELS